MSKKTFVGLMAGLCLLLVLATLKSNDQATKMMVGKFGMWLEETGRTIQIRYADWSGGFKMKEKFFPDPDVGEFQVSEKLTDKITLGCINNNDGESAIIIKALLDIKGVKDVNISPYEITVWKAEIFSWKEIIPEAENVILKHLALKKATGV